MFTFSVKREIRHLHVVGRAKTVNKMYKKMWCTCKVVGSLDLRVPSVNLQIRPESFCFSLFIFNSVSLHEKAKFWRILKRAVFTMASLNLLHQIPSGFCFPLQVRGSFVIWTSVGLTNLNMREKMKWIPLLAKTSHHVKSQLDSVAPVTLRAVQKRPLLVAPLLFSG